MQVSERKARHGNVISAYIAGGRPNVHSDRSGQEQIALMQPYKGYFISGSPLLVHPVNWSGTLAAAFMCLAALVQSWKSRAFSFSSSP
jgi:hypothetical protein